MFFARSTLPFSLLLLLGGIAIKANELRIHNVNGLINFSNDVINGTNYSGTTVYLGSDIDFTLSLSQQFQPIGKESYPFKGIFDGQGHIISNLNLNSSLTHVGLFGYSTGATIKNVVLDDSCSFVSSYSGTNITGIGSISGYCESSNINSVVNMGRVTYTGGYSAYLGGIAGRLVNLNYITNCANYGSVAYSGAQTIATISIGGIVGFCAGDNSKIIQNCANYGTITHNGKSTDLHMGGIVGNVWKGYVKIENCVSAGRIVNSKKASGKNYTGSLVGSNTQPATGVNATNSFWTSDVGYDNVCGYNPGILSITNSSLKELNKETVDDLNGYAEKNSTWNKWLLNTNEAQVTFKVNDYKGFITSNKVILLPGLAATGNNTFKGWFADSGYSTPLTSYEVSEGMTLYGLYGVVVTVTFDGNGGTPSQQSKDVLFNKTYGALPEPTRSGYCFAGWFTSKEEGEGEGVTEEDIVRIVSDHTLYAQWSINNYTITFVFYNGKEDEVRILNFNETIVYPENVTREGYIFIGWSPKPEIMPAENINVTAQWIEITPELVEIVFAKKDLKEEEIREIVKEYTQEEFTIEKIETDENTGETKVIVKFIDVETAQSFIETVNLSSGTKNIIKKVGPIHGSIGNSSTLFNPNVLFYSLL